MFPAIVAAAGTIIGSQIASQGAQNVNSANIRLAREQMSHNEKMMDKQNQFSLDMWNRTNEYNDPLHQIDRLKAAGLNPLYYGLDGSSADSFESAAANPYQLPSLSNPYESFQNLGNLGTQLAQIENLQANTAKTNNENLTETKRREQVELDCKKAAEDIKNLVETRNLTVANRKLAEQSLEWNERLNDANLHYTESASKLNDSQVKRIEELLEGEKVLQSKTLDEFEHRWDLWSAAASKDRALAGLTRKDIENYALIHMDSGILGSGLSLRNLIIGAIESLKRMPAKGEAAHPDFMQGSSPLVDPVYNGGSR